MSVSIDEKVVEMRFNNKQFEEGIQTTLKSISDLNRATEFTESQQSIKKLQKSFDNLDSSKMMSSIEGLSSRMSTLGVAGAEVIRRITDSAIDLGTKVASVIAKPIEMAKSGGIARALNIEQAKFQLEGLGVKWSEIEEDINYGVADTAYGLDAAAKAASQLVASNVKLGDEMRYSLRGISGVAAMTSSSYEDISNIFTTVAGNGKLMTMELRQLSSRGLNIAAELAKQLGKSEQEIREMVTKGKIDFKTFAKAMDDAFGTHAKDANNTFTGAMSNVKAALSRIGALFASPFYKAIIKPLNSLRALIDTIKNSMVEPTDMLAKFMDNVALVSDKFMSSKKIIESVANITEGVSNIFKMFGKILQNVAAAFVTVFPPKTVDTIAELTSNFLEMTKSLTLTQSQMDKIQNVARGVFSVFSILGNVIGLFFDIIRDIAKSKVGSTIGKVVQAIANGLQNLDYFIKVVRAAYNYASEAFGGIGGVLKNFGTVVDMIMSTIGKDFLTFGDVISIIKGDIEGTSNTVTRNLARIAKAAKAFADAVIGKVGLTGEKFSEIFDKVAKAIGSTGESFDNVKKKTGIFGVALKALVVVAKVAIAVFATLLEFVGDFIKTLDLGKLIEEGLTVVIIEQISTLLTKIQTFMKSIKDGFTDTTTTISSIKTTLTSVSGAFAEFQKSMQMGRIVQIALAIGLLSMSLYGLSKIGSLKELGIAITALASISSILLILSKAFRSLGDGKFIKKGSIQIIIMAAAISILAGAMVKVSGLNFEQVTNASIALAAAMAILVGAFNMMASTSEKGMIFTKSSKKWVKGAFQMILMAEAIKILANVIVKLGSMEPEKLASGMIGLAAATSALAIAFNMMASSSEKGKIFTKSSKKWVQSAFQMILMAEAINVIASVIVKLGKLNPTQLATGMIGLAASVAGLAVAFNMMSSSMNSMSVKGKKFASSSTQWVQGAAQMLVMAAAIKVLSSIIIKIGQLEPQQLAVGMIGLAASVAALVVAFNALSSASTKFGKLSASSKQWIEGATKLIVMAAAIKLVASVISKLSGIDNIEQGILGLGVAISALVGMSYALSTLGGESGQIIKGAAAMVIMGVALGMVTGALTAMSLIASDELPVVLAATVGPLLALSAAAIAMNGAVKGAAAMVIVAAAFDILTPAIIMLGSANMESVSNALMILGAVVGATALEFVVLGVAAKIFSKSAFSMMSASLSLVTSAAGFLIFAAGVYIIVKAVDLLVETFGKIRKGTQEFVENVEQQSDGFFSKIGKVFSKVIKWIGKAIVSIGKLIKDSIPKFVGWAMDTIIVFIESMAEAIDEYLPRILAAVKKLGLAIFEALKETFGDVFQKIEKINITKIGTVVIGIALLLRTLAASVAKIKPSNIAGAIILIAGVIGISIALIQLSAVPWDNLMVAVASLSTCMIGLTLMMRSLSETKFNVTSMAAMIIGAATLMVIAKSLEPLAQYQWSSLLAASVALSGVLVAYGLIFKMISSGNMVTKTVLANIGLFALGTLALLPIAASLKSLAESDWQSLLASAASLTMTFIGYALVFKVLSTIPITGALAAIANLAIAIGGLVLILGILGGISQIDGVKEFVSNGASFAQQIGEAIGGFVGSIVSGFGKAVSSMLPQIGLDLSMFMANAMPFFVGVKAVGEDTMNAVKSLAQALIMLTAAELVQGIASFFGADNDFKKLGEQLGDFADGMVTFADKTKDIDPKGVEAAANAAKMLAEFANSVPLTGGFLGDLMGNRDLKGFSDTLPDLGDGLAKFAKKVGKLDNDAVEAAANSAKMLAELNQDVPLQGGLLGDILGNRSLGDFGKQLPDLGDGLAKFAKKTKKLDTDSIEAASSAAEMLVNLNQNIPLQGGLLGDLMGNRNLGDFGKQLPKLGEGLAGFADEIKDVNTDAATDAASVAGILAELSKSLPNTGGIKSWFSGEVSLADFGDDLPDLGKGIKEFSDEIDGINSTNITSAGTLLSSIVDVIKKVSDENAGGSNILGDFGTNLESLGKAYSAFLTYANKSSTGLDNFSTAMGKIIEEIKKISDVDTSKLQGFSDDIRSITEVGINDITTASEKSVEGAVKAVNDKADSFKTAAGKLISALNEGISTNSYKVKDVMTKAATDAATAVGSDTMKNKFKTSGKYMVEGFALGMSDNEKMQKVVEAAKKMANKAKDTVNKELDVNSPSKEMETTGGFTVDGFVEGVENGYSKVKESAVGLVDSFKSKIDFTSTAGQSGSVFSTDSLLSSLGLDNDETKKAAEKAGEDVGKSAATGAGSTDVTNAATKSGKSIGSSVSKGVKLSSKDLKKALKAYSYIMGEYIKQGKAFPKAMLEATISKKGLGNLKVTPKYILSGIDNKYLRTAAANLGTSVAKAINSAMRKELQKSDKTSGILEKLDKAGKNLVDARKRKKEAKATINNSKSTKKAIAAARKELAAANKDISKYQKQVDKYEKQLKKAGSSIAKTLTQQAIGEMTNNMNKFVSLFDSMGKGIGSTLVKIPSVLSSYMANIKSSSSYAKDVVKSVSSMFGSNIASMDAKTQANIDALNKKLKDANKKARDARKILNDDKASKKEQKKAKKQLSAAEKTISNINTKIAKEKSKLGASSVVDKFAERLYYNSDAYKQEVETVKASTKKIKKIQKDAKEAKKKMNKATKAEDKKKYADELKELQKQYKAEEKVLKKSATNIAKGPQKALKAFKQSLKETLKSMLSISSLDFTPRITLEGFDKFEKTTNLVSQASVNTDIFAKAVASAGKKFSIFGDIADETTKSFNFFNDAISTGINLLERFTKVGSVEKQALFENADSQLEAYEEFYKGIEELRSRGLSDTMVDDLKSQGPDALNYIRGFLSMSADELASYNKRIDKMNEYGAANYTNELKASMKKAQKFNDDLAKLASLGVRQEIIAEFESMGADSAQGYIDSLLNTTKDNIDELNSIYGEYSKGSSKSMLDAAEAQYQASITYSKVISKLKETALDPAIIKEIEEMSQEEAMAYARSILNNLDDIPRLNELYWASMSNDKTMRQQMEEANAEAQAFADGLKELTNMGLHKDFVDYVRDLGVEEGMSVIQRVIREIGSLDGELREQEVALFNSEYLKSKNDLGQGPMDVLLDNLSSQIDGYDEYTANLDKVLDKLGGDSKSEYFKYLKEMGMDGAEYVEALANATEDQIERYRQMIDARESRNRKERAQAVIDSWNEELDTIKNYSANVARLINMGASQTLIDDIASMDIKEASSKVEALLDMDKATFAAFNKTYTNMMNQDVGKLVNQLTGVYAAAGNVTAEQSAEIMQQVVDGNIDIQVKGSYDAAKKTADAYKEGTLAVYPELQDTGKSAGLTTVEAFSTALSDNVGTIPLSAIVKAFTKGLSDAKVSKKLVTAGEAIVKGTSTGIKNKEEDLKKRASLVAKAAYEEMKAGLTKKKGKAIGKNFCTGLDVIFNEYSPILVGDIDKVVNAMTDIFDQKFSYDSGFVYGQNIGTGIAEGLISMAAEIDSATNKLIEAITLSAAREAAAIEAGKAQVEAARRAAESGINTGSISVDDAVDGLNKSINNIKDRIKDKLDTTVVITPELDLSKVTQQANKINSMVNSSSIGATLNTNGSGSSDGGKEKAITNYNFEQNNYSPKALTREEIYRNTRNQFAQLRGVVG